MRKVAVLVVHGIGWHETGGETNAVDRWVTRLMDPVRNKDLLKAGLAPRLKGVEVEIEMANWSQTVQPIQDAFEARYAGLRGGSLRRVMISALGDAAQYEAAVFSKGNRSFPTHDQIHGVVAERAAALAKSCGPDAPLIVVGHSLGAHILSNHIYDQQQSCAHGAESPLERMETLRGVVSLGCNIPLFVMGASKIEPIVLGRARWLNYYDPDDVLAFPLRPLYFPDEGHVDYDLRDIEVEVGNLVLSRTPASHGYYWTNDIVLNGIGELVRAAAQ